MKTEAECIILEAAKQIGKSAEDVQDMIRKIVDENWIQTKDALSALSLDDWKYIGIPLQLHAKIRELCRQSGESVSNTSGKQEQNEGLSEDLIKYDLLETNADLPALLRSIRDAVVDRDILESILSLLLRIIDNILSSPNDSSKRSIRKTTKKFEKDIAPFPDAIDFLCAIGFIHDGDSIKMPVIYLPTLQNARRFLKQILTEIECPAPPEPKFTLFDPYRATLNYSGAKELSARNKWEALHEFRKITEAVSVDTVQKRIKQLRHLLETGGNENPIPLAPRVMHISELYEISKTESLEDKHYCNEKESLSLDSKTIDELCESWKTGPKFTSKLLEELRNLEKKDIFRKCILRILFPDDFVLQIELIPSTSINKARGSIQSFLNPAILDWDIFQSPPMTILRSDTSLYEQNLVPNSTVRFKILKSSTTIGNFEYLARQYYPSNLSQYILKAQKCETESLHKNEKPGELNTKNPGSIKERRKKAMQKFKSSLKLKQTSKSIPP